jgi:hypothetical protein
MMSKEGCCCGGWTTRDISPWCSIHATIENLTEDERLRAIRRLRDSMELAQLRIDALTTDLKGGGE